MSTVAARAARPGDGRTAGVRHEYRALLGRRQLAWAAVRDSLWFAPAVAVLTATLLAVYVVSIPTPHAGGEVTWVWLLGGGAEGARGVLSAIAGSLITVTGVVFSVTIVALQLASSQFTPRVLRSFVADRTNQVVLAIFIGTFTYSLLVLRSIHTTSGGRELFVPQVAVAVAVMLLLVSIGALIVFINHAARSIQASVILDRETRQTLARIAVLFPDELTEPDWHAEPTPPLPASPPAAVAAVAAGYVQMVRADALAETAEGRRLTIRMDARLGAFVVPGQPLASVWPAGQVDDAVRRTIRGAFLLGPERTPEQDVEYGIIEIADIAVKALSPGINDPTTAMLCIDRLTQILAALARRRLPSGTRVSDDGTLRFIAQQTSFARATGLAFDQIRQYGSSSPAILKKLLDAVGTLRHVVRPADASTLAEQMEAIRQSAITSITHPSDRASVEAVCAEVLACLPSHARSAAAEQ